MRVSLLSSLLFIFSAPLFACMVPRAGDEFNALIAVKGPDGNGLFTVTLPEKLEGYKYPAEIELSYAREHESGYWFQEYSKPIKTSVRGKDIVGGFTIEKKEGYQVAISAYWPPNQGGLCGTYASSKILYEG